ncbi:anaerobic benzoate catabolism transcriptional regulator [Streptomyces sp. ADI97-07]|uniref:helix-turn-helix domain-containing protein n=1 Tax=Streptomyces sp. ADI97-07 TaxID=1522762 RepID=UPI000F557FC6|nr:helix-turn-helix transcriptional regulator [Streptomyces sp. ADI97-07]RPK76593.1 anaerobic benzoate catabolism transcriptional regulator [Streptomyces sp. ADI97-07]
MSPTEPPPEWVLTHRRLIGTRIREARTARHLSQERLGELSGTDRQTINRIELGHVSTRIDTLMRIAAALEMPLADLVRE